MKNVGVMNYQFFLYIYRVLHKYALKFLTFFSVNIITKWTK